MKLDVRSLSEAEAEALAAERGMTLGQYLRAGGAEAMLDRERCCGDPGDCQEVNCGIPRKGLTSPLH